MATIKSLVNKIKKYNPEADVEGVKKAFALAKKLHRDQYRMSGEEFVQHPLGVAEILADLRLDTTTIEAALLHDVVEDTNASLEEVCNETSEEICSLIDGVTKLGQIKFKSEEEAQAENLRKMLLAMAKDVRVIIIKLADRLHNMRTVSPLDREKQRQKARETLEIYAPLAHRLGMMQLKWELEDLSFEVLEPERYAHLKKLVQESRSQREAYLEEVVRLIKKELEGVGVEADISFRPKHFYSIYQKMIQKDKDLNEIYDLSAIRVLVGSIKDCYGALGTIHSLWKPVPGRFKDYIAMPKFNLYQSLHTTVIGPQGKPLEIQIRTREMHITAEYGIAAHWRYKEGGRNEKFDERLGWLRQMLEWQDELKDPREFMRTLKIDLFVDEVYVFTPKGDVFNLPTGSTPLDFAYAVHTDVGHRCIGAKVNGQIVPLEYKLSTGDFVEILTSRTTTGPSRDWLNIVRTSRARSKIRQWFSKENKEASEQAGREMLQKELRKHSLGLQPTAQADLLNSIAKEMNLLKADDLLASIGSGKLSARQAANKIAEAVKAKEEPEEDSVFKLPARRKRKTPSASGVVVKGMSDEMLTRLSQCCNPVPYDEIVGFVTRGRGVSVHRKDCVNMPRLSEDPERMLEVSWDIHEPTAFPVDIEVQALDRTKLLKDISTVLGDAGINILSAHVQTTKDQMAVLRFSFEVSSVSQLERVLNTVRKVEAVYEVHRVEAGLKRRSEEKEASQQAQAGPVG